MADRLRSAKFLFIVFLIKENLSCHGGQKRFPTWQRMKDSNPHKQSQSLVCYHYTNPLYILISLRKSSAIIAEPRILSSVFLHIPKSFQKKGLSLLDFSAAV